MTEVVTNQPVVVCLGGPYHMKGIQRRRDLPPKPEVRVRRFSPASMMADWNVSQHDVVKTADTVYDLVWLKKQDRYVYLARGLDIQAALSMLLDSIAARGEREVVE